jgi:hypothetical protein
METPLVTNEEGVLMDAYYEDKEAQEEDMAEEDDE